VWASGVAVDSEGRLVVSLGEVQADDEGTRCDHGPTVIAFARLLPNGQPDPNIGVNGAVVSPLPPGFYGQRGDVPLIQPSGRLVVATVRGVDDHDGEWMKFAGFTMTGTPAPPPVSSLSASPGLGRAGLSWVYPSAPAGLQAIVRRAPGATPPATPTAGTGVYAGPGTAVTATGLSAGVTYSFSVFTTTGDAVSPPVSRTLHGSSLSIARSVPTLTYGSAVTISGVLRRAGTSTPITGRTVTLRGRRHGTSTWTTLASKTTSSTGRVAFSAKPARNTDYQLRFGGAGGQLGRASAAVLVNVRPRISATLSRSSAPLGSTVKLTGTVAPNHAGQRIYLQRYTGGRWRTVTSKLLSSTSSYSFSLRPATRGQHKYRTYKPADGDHAAGTSRTRTLTTT